MRDMLTGYCMHMLSSRTYKLLTLAGVLPFVAAALLPIAGIRTIMPLGDLHAIVGSYGLAIVSFLAGTHWAVQLTSPARTPFDLFTASNLIFLATWFAYVFASLRWAVLVQAAALILLLYIDYRLRKNQVTDGHYLSARAGATVAASLSLFVIFGTS